MTVIGLATAGCQGGPAAKAGLGVVTLDFGSVGTSPNADTVTNRAIAHFVDEVSSLSGGRLRIAVSNDVGDGALDSETVLLKGIEAGKYDGGWNPSRGFVSAGIHAFEALEAPFVIQSYAVEQQLVTSPLAGQMLRRLDGTGLVGLGLIAGPLRRPFAMRRLVKPGDWNRISFRIEDTPEQIGTLAALGATADVTESSGVSAAVHGGADGQEFDLFQYDYDGFANAESYVTTNLTLWPKPYVLVMNAKHFGTLTSQQQQWLRDAAQRAVHASATGVFDENPAVKRLCMTGVRFTTVTDEQLAQLRQAVEPVYDHLRADPALSADLAALQEMDATNPVPSAATIPPGCDGIAPPISAADTNIKTMPRVPDGVYRVQATAADFEALGAEPGHAAGNAGTATMTLDKGSYVVRIVFVNDPKTYVVDAGSFKGDSHTMVFFPDVVLMTRLGACVPACTPAPTPYSLGYRYADPWLTLTAGSGLSDPISVGTATSHPWRRIS